MVRVRRTGGNHNRMSLFRKEVLEHRRLRLHGEVVLTQTLSTRFMVFALVATMVIAGIWVSVGTYARIETVPGMLTTNSPATKIVATTPGVVSKLHVIEGQYVEAGDRLVVINLDRRATSGETVAGRGLDALQTRRALMEAQIALSSQRIAAERQRMESIKLSAERQLLELRDQIDLQEQAVLSTKNLLEQITQVVEKGFVSKVELERRRQNYINARQTLAGLRQQIATRQAEADQANSQISGLTVEAAQGVSEIKASLQTMEGQKAQLEGEQGYVITAPITGRITALQTARGRTVNPVIPLMIIVPDHTVFQAELYAPTRAIGFVKPGQETRILYDAFPYQKFGSSSGKIQSVSRIVMDPRESDVPIKLEEAVYRVTVLLDKQNVEAFGEKVPLQAGMTLKANIVLERQTFLSWLLQPLNAVLKRTA